MCQNYCETFHQNVKNLALKEPKHNTILFCKYNQQLQSLLTLILKLLNNYKPEDN